MEADAITVVFDGDQTLWDFRAALDRALAETRHEIARVTGIDIARIPLVSAMTAARDRLVSQSNGTGLEVARRAAFAELLAQIGVPADDAAVEHINEFFVGRRYEMCRPYRDTVPALRSLAERFRLVLLSNGNSAPERIGLGGLFEHTFFADEIGAEKPSPDAYAHVARVCGSTTFVSVGDSLVNDIEGPAAHGWHTVWINRDNQALPDHIRPDAILVDLEGLEAAIDQITS